MSYRLASRFSRSQTSLRSVNPLADDQIRAVAPSIFATEKHESRSERYAYVPTCDVLQGLRRQGFQPFMVAQTRVRDEGKREHAKHMLRLRHADQLNAAQANEIVLLNSHDGSSSFQLLAGVFRFVCSNGMVCGDVHNDVRVRHSGRAVDDVIEGAFRVLEDFEQINDKREGMQAVTLNAGEQAAFARAALALKYDTDTVPAPITEAQLLAPRRREDLGDDLWKTFNRLQENAVKGGLDGRSKTGKRMRTRPVEGIDSNVKLNRVLWTLAEEMQRLKA